VSKINPNVIWLPAQAAAKLQAKRAARLAALSPQEHADLEDFRRLPLEEQQRQLQWLRKERELEAHAANRALQLAMSEEPGTAGLEGVVEGLAAFRGVPPSKIKSAAPDEGGPTRYDDAKGDDPPPFTRRPYQPPSLDPDEPRAPPPGVKQRAKKSASRFVLTRFANITPFDGSDYRVKGLLPRSGIIVIWGPPKCGKSFWAFDLLMHIALGWSYRGLRVKQGAVVYVCLEGARGFYKRVEAFRRKKLNDGKDDPPMFVTTAPLSLIHDHAALIKDIKTQVGEDETPTVVCIDTLNRSLVGSESSDEDMGAYIRAADAVRDAFDCLVVIVHHCPHDAQRPRGHSSLIGALDAQIATRRDKADNVITELELSKDGEVGLTFVSRLERVELGLDEDGDPITSCVILAVEDVTPAKKQEKPKPLPRTAVIALRALHDILSEIGAVPPPSTHIPANVKTVSVDKWRERAVAMGISTGEDRAQRAAFQRGTEALIALKKAAIWQDQAWPVYEKTT
jgi:hypothetical protein